MKNKIQSYVGMRLGGCRLIDTLTTHLSPTNHPLKHGVGKYIFSFLLVLAMSIGNVWGELTAHTPGVYEKTTGEGGYGLTMVSYDPDGAGDSPAKNYEVYYFSWKSSKLYLAAGKSYVTDNTAYCLISNSGTSTTDGIDFGWGNVKCGNLSGSNTSPAAEWAVPANNSSTHYISLTNSTSLTLKVSGYDQFSFAGRDNHASTTGKQFVVTIDGVAQTFTHSATDQTVYRFDLTTGEHTIVVTGNGTDANRLRCFSLRVPSCDDANASIIANTSIYVNDELDLEFSSDNTNSVVYDIKKGGSATSDASVTAGVFKATVAGTYVVTATQAKDASGHCAVEESVTITVNSKTPVSSVSISGDATAYIGIAKTLTATADQAVSEYKWEVDGVDQGVDAASFNFLAAAAGTYSIVCKARNSFNDPGEYIASSAHSITVTKLCGTLVSFTVSGGTSAADLSGILSASATPEVSLTTGSSSKLTVDEVEYTGYKMDRGKYVGVTLTSGSFKAGDVVSFMITTASNMGGGSALYLYDTKTGSNQIATLASSSTGWTDFVLTSATTGVYLYRSNPDNEYPQNPFVAAVKVTRSCETSTDCEIKSLTINGEAITPVGKVYSYEVAAASALTEVPVAYTIHPLATGSPASGFNVTVPAAGDPANTQTITVTAEDGTHSDTYTISVTKAATASDVVTLDALAVTGYTLDPTFDAATLAYNITKAYGAEDPTSDKVTYTKSEEAQNVDVVYDGTNHKFVITVTAEDNTTTQDYEITINEAEAPKSLSRVLFSNGFDAFIDNTNHTVKAYYLAGQAAPTATTITAGAGTAGELSEGKIRVTGADDSYVDYIVTLEAVTPNTASVAEADPAGEFAGDEAWVKNGLLVYGNAAGYSAGDKWYVNRRLTKGADPEDDQRVIAGWVRSYFFVGNASKFIMTVGGNRNLDYTIDGGTPVENVNVETLEIALTKGNHMIEIVSHQQSGDCRLSAPKLVELPASHTVTYMPGDGEGAWVVDADATEVADCPGTFTAPTGKVFNGWKNESDDSDVAVGAIVEDDMNLIAQWINVYAVTFNMNGHGDAIDPQNVKAGAKATRPDDPSESGYDFGGWFTDNGTFEAPFDFNTPIIAATPLYAKWTADPCPDKKSIVKAVMATNTTATVTGYNSNEYAGGYIVNNLADDASNTNMYDFGEGEVKGFKLKGSNSAIFATLSKGGFEVGDQVVFAVTKNAGDNKLAIYAAKDKDHVLKLVELDVDAAGIYTYRLTQDNIDAIEAAGSDYLSIGTFRGDYNPYIYSVELKGCRSWAIFHTLTFKNIDGTATIAAEPLEEGAYASTVAPVAPKITLKRFLGWSESIGGSTVDLTTYTITEDKTLYAVYEDIVCPTTGTVYKFEIKDELPSENLPTSTDKDMSSYITATGDGYLTYTATANNKATINSDGTIQMKDASAAYLKVELECALAAGDQIRAHVTNNPMRVQVGTTYDSNKDLILAKNAYEFVAITSAMEGKQVLYITRSSNGNANLADFEIYRPAKFDVSFDMMGHGSAIADIEDVLEGSKIVAPTAPTDEDFAFAGWYKENTLENEWDFDIDVVNAATTLYAKWLDKSDATLKSLQYGSTEIVLEAGVYEYNVTLSSLTSSVPALTAVANSPLATPVVVDATAFDSEGNATSTVTVTPAVGSAQVYTVNFARGEAVDQVNVTAATTWDWSLAGSTTLENITDVVLANVPGITNDATFNSQALLGTFNKLPGDYFQGSKLSFTTEVAGLLTITFRGTNNHARHMQVCIGNEETVVADWDYNSSSTSQTKSLLIPVGKVTLKAFEGEAAQNVRIYNMALKTDPDYTRDVTEGRYGTICLPNGGVMTGAEIFEIAYYGETSQKIFLDNIINGEMVAGRPYIFLPKEGATQLAVFYTDEANASQGSYNGLIGFIGDAADEYFYIPAGEGNYILQNNLYREVAAGAQARILSNRAYIKLSAINLSEPALAPGRRRISMSVMSEQVTTGMENTGFESEAPRKVLINGELFIIRGEKMFDAKGQLVK